MVKIRNFIRCIAISIRYFVLTRFYGMDISRSARVSFCVKLDKTNPHGVHIGEESFLASGSVVLTHDYCRNLHVDTYIGKRCFVGVNAIIMCGVRIGDNVVIGSGAVVTKDVPSHCMVAGNPARVIREGINTIKFGQLDEQQTTGKTE